MPTRHKMRNTTEIFEAITELKQKITERIIFAIAFLYSKKRYYECRLGFILTCHDENDETIWSVLGY